MELIQSSLAPVEFNTKCVKVSLKLQGDVRLMFGDVHREMVQQSQGSSMFLWKSKKWIKDAWVQVWLHMYYLLKDMNHASISFSENQA